MPPKSPSSVDGISKPAAPQGPPVEHTLNLPPNNLSAADMAPAADALQPGIKQQVKTSKPKRGPAIPILITLIFMVLLIGLAYFAYTKSK